MNQARKSRILQKLAQSMQPAPMPMPMPGAPAQKAGTPAVVDPGMMGRALTPPKIPGPQSLPAPGQPPVRAY
jgi:hypothetical protein